MHESNTIYTARDKRRSILEVDVLCGISTIQGQVFRVLKFDGRQSDEPQYPVVRAGFGFQNEWQTFIFVEPSARRAIVFAALACNFAVVSTHEAIVLKLR